MIRILLADDQDLLCEFLQTSLETEPDLQIVGHANNGQIALEKVEQLQPDIVLIDINMPVMDGLTATEKIVHDFPETRVIVLSGSEDSSHRSNAMNAGAKSYIAKTAKASKIVEEIRAVYREGRIMEPESDLTEAMVQLNQVKQEMKDGLQQVQLKLRQIEHQETEIKQRLGQLDHRQEDLSQDILGFKSNFDTILGDLRRTVTDSKSNSTEINRLQTLVEGQLSYIHNLNKRFNSLRKYFVIASSIAAIALLFSLIGLFF